jgi:predicted glycosyltransferase
MNIIFDLVHPAHINLFKRAIRTLHENGDTVIVTCINRGKLPNIVKQEIDPIPVNVIGRHRGTTISILFEANMLRFFQMLRFILTQRVDIGMSFGSFLLGAIMKLRRKPNIHLSDDPERKVNGFLEILTCDERYLPPIARAKGKTQIFNALKEWAYLSPTYFKPDPTILEDYRVAPRKYIFIREVSSGSLNYKDQGDGLVASFAHDLPKDLPVLLSLEDKTHRDQYPAEWIILQEPLRDIHSLIYFSSIVISSGDSMAREGTQLGVPSIYCGSREMQANQLLIDKKLMFKIEPDSVPGFVRRILNNDLQLEKQDDFRTKLLNEWVDVTEFVLEKIARYR